MLAGHCLRARHQLRRTTVLPRSLQACLSKMSSTTSTLTHSPNTDQDSRRYPLRKPPGHKPPMERWMLRFPEDVTHLHTLYIGLQSTATDSPPDSSHPAYAQIKSFLATLPAHVPTDVMRVTHGFDYPGTMIWVSYMATSSSAFPPELNTFAPTELWKSLSTHRKTTGIWTESLTTPVERFEANYSRTAHTPGAAQLPSVSQNAHELTGYWGAARDRVPQSECDLFVPPASETAPPTEPPTGLGQRIFTTPHGLYDNMAHIRSGQWWAQCPPDEEAAYLDNLQPALMEGMHFLWDHAAETGTLGLRVAQNVDETTGEGLKETCGVGFFRNWADLEMWSSTSPSHLKIFTGAVSHATQFGPERKLMTWHEVSVCKRGEVQVDYVNCVPETGVMKWVRGLEREALGL